MGPRGWIARTAHRILSLLLPAEHRSEIVGEIDRRWAGRGPGAGWEALWYLRQLAGSVLPALRLRVGDRAERRSSGGRHADARRPTLSSRPGPVALVLAGARHGLRVVRGTWGASGWMVATLALGIGTATALFSVVDAVVLRPLPYPEPDQVMVLWNRSPSSDVAKDWHAPAHFAVFRDRLPSLTDMTLLGGGAGTGSVDGAPPEGWELVQTTSAIVPLLGLQPELGRMLHPDDDLPDAPAVAVLGHDTWQARFAGDPEIVGKTLAIGTAEFEIVGVVSESTPLIADAIPTVRALTRVDAMMSLPQSPGFMGDRGGWNWNVLGRLASGRTPAHLDADIGTMLSAGFIDEFEIDDPDYSVYAVSLVDEMIGALRPMAFILLVGAALILLVSCGNVALLLLARGESRRQEFAVRRAIGADRMRVVSQVVGEAIPIALLAAVAGILVARLAVGAFLRFGTVDLPRLTEVGLDARVLGFAIVAASAAALLATVLPALRVSRGSVMSDIRTGGRGDTRRDASLRLRLRGTSGIAALQIALSLVLLFSANLLVRSYRQVSTVDVGFERSGVMTLLVTLPGAELPSDQRWPVLSRVMEEVTALPGVEASGAANLIPLGSTVAWGGAHVEGVTDPVVAELRTVTPGYFDAMGIDVLAGRGFETTDMVDAAPVGIVDRALAERYWPGRDPLGRTVGLGADSLTVVGVVESVRQYRIDEESPRVFIYYPYGALSTRSVYLTVRGSVPLEPSVPRIRTILEEVAPRTSVGAVESMDRIVSRSLAARRTLTVLMSAFAVVSLLLAVVGTYGLVSFRITSSRRELGLRRALGAGPRNVVGMAVRYAGLLGLMGVGLGLPGAFLAGRGLGAQLYGVGAFDPFSLIAGGAVLTTAAIIAALFRSLAVLRAAPASVFDGEG